MRSARLTPGPTLSEASEVAALDVTDTLRPLGRLTAVDA